MDFTENQVTDKNIHLSYNRLYECENRHILPTVEKIMYRYLRFNPVACTWHDIGPEPFDQDFTAAVLDDYNDMFIVLAHPTDTQSNLGIHIKLIGIGDTIGFELNEVTFDEDCYLTEEELIAQADRIVAGWTAP